MKISTKTTWIAAGVLLTFAGIGIGAAANENGPLPVSVDAYATDPVARAADTLLAARFDNARIAAMDDHDARIWLTLDVASGSTAALIDTAGDAGMEAVASGLLDSDLAISHVAQLDFEGADALMAVLFHPAFMTYVAQGDEHRRGTWNAMADQLEAQMEFEI